MYGEEDKELILPAYLILIIFDKLIASTLNCSSVITSLHAFKKMVSRNITDDDVKMVIRDGEIIKEYPNDKPYPSKLLYKMIGERPIHVVAGQMDKAGKCVIITVYVAGEDIWETDFKTKKKSK